MNTFFLIIEILSYAFAFFILYKKKELAIIYIPVIIFANIIIEPRFSASIYYATISLLIFACILRNTSFYKDNIYAILLCLYFIILLPRSEDLVAIRPNIFAVFWLFLSIPLISALYQKYTRDVIFKEVTNAGLLILILFIVNVLVSTKMHYSPNAMYGITKGILYGKLYGAGFNILGIAIFITALRVMAVRNTTTLVLLFLSLAFIILSIRRSVLLISSLGVAVAFLTLLTQQKAKKFIVLGSIIFVAGYVIYSNTNFKDEFNERYELRKLDERELGEEKRFFEYEMVYKDMFVYNDYSPLYGYELFNSSGNYGKGVFEFRTLHGDLPSIAHSSGILGLILYLLMIKTAFLRSLRAASSTSDKLIIFFCAVAFLTFTITGRYTETSSMMLLFLILSLPLAMVENYSTDFLAELEHSDQDQEIALNGPVGN